ncbi:endolytic transglycosylase MltG [uncultured Microbacterium sp.]|uniref:endolytic transglycosylase MltG n=1 Tax=uncultured Microbacterium sp. TaxID=191216 RepID=UPI0025F2FD04|nr:endolytic transglycosylase MltG [uncultured Microbacterium sp.]
MTDREDPAASDAAHDLFRALPDPQVEAPRPVGAAPAPGSRRAARAAAQQGPAPQEAAPQNAVAPQDGDARSAADAPEVPPVPAGPGVEQVGASRPAAAEPTTRDTARAEDPSPAAPLDEPTAGASGGGSATEDPSHATLEALFRHEPDHAPTKPRSRRRGCLVALIIVFVLVGGAAAGGLWVWNQFGSTIAENMGWGPPKDYAAGQATGEALVTIAKGDAGQEVSTALYDAGVTRTKSVFYDMLVTQGVNPTFYPGVYKLQTRMTAAAALKALQDPKTKMENSAIIPEGLTVDQTIEKISKSVDVPLADLQAAVKTPADYGVNAPSLEGWLFPALYEFAPKATAKDVITTLVKRTRDSLAAAEVPAAEEERVLTIASIVQREARAEADFYKVSRVIQNRLDKGMKLQMDSTAQYGYGELHAGSASTSDAAQNDDNAWNTYVIDGLPKTPIANPGDKAIDAAMHPADGPWLYFVTVNLDTGETVFSSTYEEHEAAVKQWQDWCKANPDSGC